MKHAIVRALRYLWPLCFMLSILLCNYLYELTNGVDRPLHEMELFIDKYIPFVEAFIVPYIIWGPFIFLSFLFFFFRNRSSYYRMIVSSVTGHFVSYGFYMLYQTTVPRPAITPDTWLLRMVQYIYTHDEPVNCFPSIHVLTTYLMMRAYAMERLPRILQWLVQSIGLSIILSTVFVKQHVVADIIGAVVLAEVLLLLVYQTYPKGKLVPQKAQAAEG